MRKAAARSSSHTVSVRAAPSPSPSRCLGAGAPSSQKTTRGAVVLLRLGQQLSQLLNKPGASHARTGLAEQLLAFFQV